jgi:hypothetical protein
VQVPDHFIYLHHFLLISQLNLCVYFPSQIQEIRELDDGSSCVFSHGLQRFRLIRHWLDIDGVVSLQLNKICLVFPETE